MKTFASRALLAVLGLCAALLLVPVGSAHAATLLSCVGTETDTYDPPVTLTPQMTTIHVVGNLPLCPLGGSVSSVRWDYSTSNMKSCVDLLTPNSGTMKLLYNDGLTSDFTYTTTITVVGGNNVVTQTGTITAGEFAGATAEAVKTQLAIDPLCIGGIASSAGATTLTIVSV